jgi:hypothetical protein
MQAEALPLQHLKEKQDAVRKKWPCLHGPRNKSADPRRVGMALNRQPLAEGWGGWGETPGRTPCTPRGNPCEIYSMGPFFDRLFFKSISGFACCNGSRAGRVAIFGCQIPTVQRFAMAAVQIVSLAILAAATNQVRRSCLAGLRPAALQPCSLLPTIWSLAVRNMLPAGLQPCRVPQGQQTNSFGEKYYDARERWFATFQPGSAASAEGLQISIGATEQSRLYAGTV